MFSYLQKIGKALMVPVAVLPAAAIMLGLGYWIDPTGWGANSQLAAFLIKAGAAVIDKSFLEKIIFKVRINEEFLTNLENYPYINLIDL